jgi:hypothetical protein
MKVPAGTSWAVIVVFATGKGIPVRLAQFDAAAADTQPSAVVASNAPTKVSPEFCLVIAFLHFVQAEVHRLRAFLVSGNLADLKAASATDWPKRLCRLFW